MKRLDMCNAIKEHKVSFALNPTDEWASFPSHLQAVVQRPWTELKYFVGNTKTINPAILRIPDTCGGIYIFLIKPNVVPDAHLYLGYIGRAKLTSHQNLRKRVKEYAAEETRLKIVQMKEMWGPYLYLRYLPLDNNDLIVELEKELIRVILPPFNDKYPGVYNSAMHAAF